MVRRLAVLVSFFAAGFTPVLAQTQAHPPHPPGKPHHPADHAPLDPALHAAMHARLHGSWFGTLSAIGSDAAKMQVSIANDRHGNLTVKMNVDRQMKAGLASDVSLDAHGLHWTQPLSGASCKATAVLDAATHHLPPTMRGTMACEHGEVAFALHKTKG
jgi:hypothetical protein